jgi:Phosphotransferase enzyme family
MPTPFSVDAVARALLGAPVRMVEVVEKLDSASALVARLRIHFFNGREPLKAIGKSASGQELAAAQRELRFFQQLAPLWDSPAPKLLGYCTNGARDDGASAVSPGGAEDVDLAPAAQLLLLMEDLGASGYSLVSRFSPAQLRGVVDTLVHFHARFWGKVQGGDLDGLAEATASITRSAQAWPPELISVHAADVHRAATSFLAGDQAQAELSAAERAQLDELCAQRLGPWEQQFLARVAGGHALTLVHGDFHLMGNLFFAAGEPMPRVIDWSELKPGLGPHDVGYFLHGVPLEPGQTRLERDLAILRSYWEGLHAAGIRNYSWELCQWDFRFSAFANFFQALFQHSPYWIRVHLETLAALDALAALRTPPPLG